MKNTPKGKALFIRDVSERFVGSAAHYKLSPPLTHKYGVELETPVEHVIVWASPLVARTMMFEATESGDLVSWADLNCVPLTLDHEDLLSSLGYEIEYP